MQPLKNKASQATHGVQTTVQDELIAKFLSHVHASPDRVAVMTTDGQLTYQQLYDDVMRWKVLFSERIHHRAVVCLERTPRLLSVLLVLQWLEITYIPVDTSMPVERLRAIIEDSEAQAFLYDIPHHPEYATLPCLCLELTDVLFESLTMDPVRQCCLPKQQAIAYIIYTSGTTGNPKGVAISRGALNNFLASMSRYFLKEDRAFLLAITTIAFDIAALELYLPLWQQKTVLIANQEQHKDPFCITALLNDYPITLLQATPAMWKMLDDVFWAGKSELVALCGGEALTQALAERLLTEVAELWNMYGPTEATVWCALKQIRPNEAITIGYPIDNIEMRVMDASHQILPPYVKGELFIGGLGLAEGYVNNAALTQSRFISCSNALGGRLYRVGDIACMTKEGEFIIYGRTDNQIKLHGFRIELEDIEAHIQTFKGIRECAVIVYHEQLVAYICLAARASFSEVALIAHLKAVLPDYMLPKRVLVLEKMPLTTSGKIDRRALPKPTQETIAYTDTEAVTPLQLALIGIWAEVLALSTVGIHDNFFELGGHSLMAARIIAKIDQQIQKQITLHDFYHAPTILQLASIVSDASYDRQASGGNNYNAFPSTRWHPLNDFQLSLWLSHVFVPNLKQINLVERKRVQGPLNKMALDLALQLVFQKHEGLSYTFNRLYPAQKRRTKRPLRWIESSLPGSDDLDREMALTASFEELKGHHPWSAQHPMIIAKLFYLEKDQVELQIGMPHLIADVNSFVIFFQDLSNAYLFYANHTSLHTKESFQPFKSYALQQSELFTKYGDVDTLFWKHYLQDAGLFPFPDKYVVKDIAKKQIPFSTYIEIPRPLIAKLRQFCIQNNVNLNDVLCGAVALSLLSCSEKDITLPHKLLINTVKSTRDDPDYDDVIGCFLRFHPIKLDLKEGSTLPSLAKEAQRSTIETTEYQRASSLIKLASIGQVPTRQKSLKTVLISWASTVLSRVSKRFNIDPTLMKACTTLASFDRQNHFLVNVNILSNFVEDESKISNNLLFDAPCQPIPLYPYDISNVDYVFDVCFLVDSSQNTPFLVISSNLTPAFREQFGRTMLDRMHVDIA